MAALGLGPGLEIDGFQCIRGYPNLTDEFVYHFKTLVARSGLEACCLDAFPDFARRPDRLMGLEEQVVFLEAQIEAAHKLGIPLLWLSSYVQPELLARLLPAAERHGVTLGIEIGAPLQLDGKESDYTGYVSMEWGGQIWADGMDGFASVKKQHDLCRRLLTA